VERVGLRAPTVYDAADPKWNSTSGNSKENSLTRIEKGGNGDAPLFLV
jgi:hypothetical protein